MGPRFLLTVSDLARQFGRSNADLTWGITYVEISFPCLLEANTNKNATYVPTDHRLVLTFRSPGAIIFGIASDRYNRKWPFILNCLLFIAFELGTGFAQTYGQFLACRALFGVAMGGLYGLFVLFSSHQRLARSSLVSCKSPSARFSPVHHSISFLGVNMHRGRICFTGKYNPKATQQPQPSKTVLSAPEASSVESSNRATH